MSPQSSDPVFQNIRFRDCVHRGIADGSPEAIAAAVAGTALEICAPVAPPAETGDVFIGVTQVLGDAAFRTLWAAFLSQGAARKPNPMEFAGYLAAHPLAQSLPPLPDLAAFDLAWYLAAQPSPTPSVGDCCLTEAMARSHPELMLRFQPGWRYLLLDWPVHHLLAGAASVEALRALPQGTRTWLRIAPGTPGVTLTELAPAHYALEEALRNGARLSDAVARARALDRSLDPFPIVAALVESGAVIDAILHPAETPPLAQSTARPPTSRQT